MNFNINGIFNPENRFWSFIDKLVNLCLLGVLWALFSLPVVTAGAATTALFHPDLPEKICEEYRLLDWNSCRRRIPFL